MKLNGTQSHEAQSITPAKTELLKTTENRSLGKVGIEAIAGRASKLGEFYNQSSQIKEKLLTKLPIKPQIAGFGAEAKVVKVGDQVTIETTKKADKIHISQDAKTGDVTIEVNGKKQTYSGKEKDNIVIKAGEGNDTVTVGRGVTVKLTIEGGDGDDQLQGGDGADTISGGKGNDRIEAGAGDDTVDGGDGRDYINGSRGKDTLRGAGGNDTIYGGDSDDKIYGGDGNDYIDGGKGNDYTFGNNGDDMVSGGIGDDYVNGGAGNDKLYAGQGKDRMVNGGGNDTIYAQTDSDIIYGAPKNSSNTVINVELKGNPGGTSVRIEGSPEFVERVEADLEFLRSSPTGRNMLESFDRAFEKSRDSRAGWVFPFNIGANDGNTVTIRETTGGSAADASQNTVWLDPVTQKPSKGADGTIAYNVSGDTLYGNDPKNPNDNWNDTPPVVVLYHEMAHDYDYVSGTLQPGEYTGDDPVDQNINNRERVAVGLPIDHDEDPSTPEIVSPAHPHILTENGLRDELGLERRPNYADPN